MDRSILFENWLKSLDIPMTSWQKEMLRFICTNPGMSLYISMPRGYGRFLVRKLAEQFEEMIKEKRIMACKENAEKDCKSYPKCEGCNSHTTKKNLTFNFRSAFRNYRDGEWDIVAEMDDRHTFITETNGKTYLTGPVTDRLHEFEKLGYEPEELKGLIGLAYRYIYEGIKSAARVIFENTHDATKINLVETNKSLPKIKDVIFNNPATIVFWSDGDKTVVKAQNGEPYDPEKGLAMAISKKALGNDRRYYDEFQKHLGRGQKHSTPEQFNSEVCHIQKLEDLMTVEEDNKVNRELAAYALDHLSKAVNDPKATKANLTCAMEEAIKCVNAILENY